MTTHGLIAGFAREAKSKRHSTIAGRYRAAAVIALEDEAPDVAAVFAQLATSAAIEAGARAEATS